MVNHKRPPGRESNSWNVLEKPERPPQVREPFRITESFEHPRTWIHKHARVHDLHTVVFDVFSICDRQSLFRNECYQQRVQAIQG